MSDETEKCPWCGKKLKHMHDTVYEIPETHIAWSERFECECGFECRNAKGGEKLGLLFVLDV